MIKFKPVLRSQKLFSMHNIPFVALLKAQNQQCFYCHKHMALSSITKDHLFPKSHGFHLRGNLVLAHRECNQLKANRYPTPAEIMRWVALHKDNAKRMLMIKIKNHKPVFKLIMTEELINDYLS